MTSFKNPCEMGSAFGGLEGDEHSSPSSFPALSIEQNSRKLFFRVAQPRRTLNPVFKIVIAKLNTIFGDEAARMVTMEGGPMLVSHVLVRPWKRGRSSLFRNADLFVVERVALEVELSFRELGYRDLITNVERK